MKRDSELDKQATIEERRRGRVEETMNDKREGIEGARDIIVPW